MSNSTSHIDIAVASIGCFADDGTLDMGEVKHLVGLALRDDVIDNEEKRVLKNVFSKVRQSDVEEEVWKFIQEIKQKHDIS